METKDKQPLKDEEEEGEFSEEFQCCICWDLLYKPVVLACGHHSCFWCIHYAMNVWHESNCPVCRHPYNHLPNVCQLLHFLLLKMYPIAYKRRERQVGEEEKRKGYFSPQFDHHVFRSHSNQDIVGPSKSLHSSTDVPEQYYSESCVSRQWKSLSFENSQEATCNDGNIGTTPSTLSRSTEGTESTATENCSLIGKELEDTTQKECSVSVSYLLCAECKKLLFRPVVLNCGHVYCEACIFTPVEETPRCPICQSLHPNGFPRVCLVLEHFLEKHFPKIYAQRREGLLKEADAKRQEGSTRNQHPANPSSMVPSSAYSWLFGYGPKVHFGVGCDSCGMQPIIGERYKCKDCMEKIGFDLCEACYNNPSKVSGRFNQQHKPEHKLEIVPLPPRLIIENEEGGFDDPEDQEDGLGRAESTLQHSASSTALDVDHLRDQIREEYRSSLREFTERQSQMMDVIRVLLQERGRSIDDFSFMRPIGSSTAGRISDPLADGSASDPPVDGSAADPPTTNLQAQIREEVSAEFRSSMSDWIETQSHMEDILRFLLQEQGISVDDFPFLSRTGSLTTGQTSDPPSNGSASDPPADGSASDPPADGSTLDPPATNLGDDYDH